MPPKKQDKKQVKKQPKRVAKKTPNVIVQVNSHNKRGNNTTNKQTPKAQMPVVVSTMMPTVAPNPSPAVDVNRAAEIAQIRQEMHRELQGQKAHLESLRKVVNDTAANTTAPPPVPPSEYGTDELNAMMQPTPIKQGREKVDKKIVSPTQQMPPQQGILRQGKRLEDLFDLSTYPVDVISPSPYDVPKFTKRSVASGSPVKTQSMALSPIKPSFASASTSTAMEAGQKRQRALRTPEKPSEIIELNEETLVKPKGRGRKSMTSPITNTPLKLPTLQQLREQGYLQPLPKLESSPMKIDVPKRNKLKEMARPQGLGTSKAQSSAKLVAPVLGGFAVADTLVPGGMPAALRQAYRKTKEFKSELEKAGGKSEKTNTKFRNWFKDMSSQFGADDETNKGKPGVYKQRIQNMENKLAGWNKLLSKRKV